MTEPVRYHSYLHADFTVQFGIQLSGVLAIERDAPGSIGRCLKRTHKVAQRGFQFERGTRDFRLHYFKRHRQASYFRVGNGWISCDGDCRDVGWHAPIRLQQDAAERRFHTKFVEAAWRDLMMCRHRSVVRSVSPSDRVRFVEVLDEHVSPSV